MALRWNIMLQVLDANAVSGALCFGRGLGHFATTVRTAK